MFTTMTATAPTLSNNMLKQARQDVSARPAWFVAPSGLDWVPSDITNSASAKNLAIEPVSWVAEPKNETLDKPLNTFTPRTELGRRLWEIRKRIVASGAHLLTSEEIDCEIAESRREWQE